MSKSVVPLNQTNNTDNFYPIEGDWRLEEYPIKESVAYEDGKALSWEIVANTTTGKLIASGVENAAGNDFVGILAEEIASTDDDYATAFKLKKVWVPVTARARALFPVKNGTFTQADVGKTVQIDATAYGLDVDTAGKGARIVKYISSTKGMCEFTLPNTETA